MQEMWASEHLGKDNNKKQLHLCITAISQKWLSVHVTLELRDRAQEIIPSANHLVFSSASSNPSLHPLAIFFPKLLPTLSFLQPENI